MNKMSLLLFKGCINLFGSSVMNNFKNFSTCASLSKAMSCTQTISDGVPRKVQWYPYPVQDSRRCYFPRPSETKRITKHGYETRMSTPGGRRTLMRRILKGRHCISH